MIRSALFVLCSGYLLAADLPAAWRLETEGLEERLRGWVSTELAAGRHVAVAVRVHGVTEEADIASADARGLEIATAQGLRTTVTWAALTPAGWRMLGSRALGVDPEARHSLVRLLLRHDGAAEAERELALLDARRIDPAEMQATCAAVAGAQPAHATTAPRPAAPSPREKPARAKVDSAGIAASPGQARVLRRLERDRFLFGFSSPPKDAWLPEILAGGARVDLRYQYICGGVNSPSNWKTWDRPAGAFATSYLAESARLGLVPMFTYYQIRQSRPGAQGEVAAVRANSTNDATMRSYIEDWEVLMRACGASDQTAIVHWEPDFSGFVQSAAAFGRDPDKARISVAATGHPAAAGQPDTLAGLCRTLIGLRDRLAPRVLLACHLSPWGTSDGRAAGAYLRSLGPGWDIAAVDCSDRDAGWKLAKNYHVDGAWWKEADFDRFRAWCADIHRESGLPVLLWQVPMGNTIMAACNDTDGHWQDNRAQHWLEDWPRNRNLRQWADAGLIGICFGAGAAGCTGTTDARKDGITNPPPAPGNRGETAIWPDDDGGYLRLRLGAFAKAGGLPFALPREP